MTSTSALEGVSLEGITRMLALTRLVPENTRRCIEKLLQDSMIDLNVAVNSVVGRGGNPLSVRGEHRRGIAALRAIGARESLHFLCSPITWVREREEFCSDKCCIDRALVRQALLFAYSDPLEAVGVDENRHVALVAFLAMTPAICSNDFIVLSSSSRKEWVGTRSTFVLAGARRTEGGQVTGVRIDANPLLYSEVFATKRHLVAQTAEYRP